jgi:hypothetical protein
MKILKLLKNTQKNQIDAYSLQYNLKTSAVYISPIKQTIKARNVEGRSLNKINKLQLVTLNTTRKSDNTNGITDEKVSSIKLTDGNNSLEKSVGISRRKNTVGEAASIYRRRRRFRRYILVASLTGEKYFLKMQRRDDVDFF